MNFALRSLAAERWISRKHADARVRLGRRLRGSTRGACRMILVDTSAWIEFLPDTDPWRRRRRRVMYALASRLYDLFVRQCG